MVAVLREFLIGAVQQLTPFPNEFLLLQRHTFQKA